MTDNVLTKLESLRIATLIMCQSATAGKGENKPTSAEVLDAAKKLHEWIKE
jgi:hypothetical protein